jgi:predicted DNA-binding transcriptional regulator AlpA
MSAAEELKEAISEDVYNDRFVDVKFICRRLGVSHVTLYAWLKKGAFIHPHHLGGRTTRFLMSELLTWEAERRDVGGAT